MFLVGIGSLTEVLALTKHWSREVLLDILALSREKSSQATNVGLPGVNVLGTTVGEFLVVGVLSTGFVLRSSWHKCPISRFMLIQECMRR